jgi:glycosyltransferase involved in cell wall biosynthesis
MAGPSIEFLGRRGDDEVADLLARCRGFLFPGLEDFGIAAVEAQAAGRPVLAYGFGGAAEIVQDGSTGILFGEQTVEAVVESMLRLERMNFDVGACRGNAERFETERFRAEFLDAVDRHLEHASDGHLSRTPKIRLA